MDPDSVELLCLKCRKWTVKAEAWRSFICPSCDDMLSFDTIEAFTHDPNHWHISEAVTEWWWYIFDKERRIIS